MFTTHETKQEFYAWWKQQDHTKHTCADMVMLALCKAYWRNPEMPDYLFALKRAFTEHKLHGYFKVRSTLNNLDYNGGRYAVFYLLHTFKGFQYHHGIFKNIATLLQDVGNKSGIDQEATNGA